MSRLRFAAARDARIEVFDRNLGWILSSHCPLSLSNDRRLHRIHPDDAPLQYGPISTALREEASNPSADPACTDAFGTWALLFKDWSAYRDLYSERTASLFLLIMAEALADEGL